MLLAGLLAACAASRGPAPAASAEHRAEVNAVLAPIEATHTAELAALDSAPAGAEAEARLEALRVARAAARREVLEPLAAAGNAEAMARLAWDLRDSDDPADVARWLDLVARAADLGHPGAHDELVRWWWHQRGDGSIAAVQANRARALVHAERAAVGGQLHSLDRIATYVAGDVHQYPASLPLARRLTVLCARAGSVSCRRKLAGGWVYDLGPPPPDDAVRGPVGWSELQAEWTVLTAEVLAHGAASIGAETACSTATPWCRGR